MPLSQFIKKFPALDVPIPEDIVSCYAMRSDDGLAVFFEFHKDFELPDHSHKGQWGTVLKGEVTITIEGLPKTYHPGDSYDIPSGAVHSVKVKAGSTALDVFEEPDRYGLRARP